MDERESCVCAAVGERTLKQAWKPMFYRALRDATVRDISLDYTRGDFFFFFFLRCIIRC